MTAIKAGQKLWLSKYALTDGVKEVESKCAESAGEKYISLVGWWNSFRMGREIWLTKAEAIAAAEAMRVKKIASLRKQIAKLEKLSFGVTA
jgi:hypothetical protein